MEMQLKFEIDGATLYWITGCGAITQQISGMTLEVCIDVAAHYRPPDISLYTCTTKGNDYVLLLMDPRDTWMAISQEVQQKILKDLRVSEHDEKEGRMNIENSSNLPWDGGYMFADTSICGNLIISFLVMYRRIEGILPAPAYKEVIQAGETFILHFAEAGRSGALYLKRIHKSFRAQHPVGKMLIRDARKWKTRCRVVYKAIGVTDSYFMDDTKDTRYKRTRTITTTDVAAAAKIILKDIRLLHRPKSIHGFFHLKDMPVHLSEGGPTDVAWAEKELQISRNLDLDNSNWEFLTEDFPDFPPNHIETNDFVVDKVKLHFTYIKTEI